MAHNKLSDDKELNSLKCNYVLDVFLFVYFTSEIRVHEPMIDLHEAKYKSRSCADTVKGSGRGGGPRGGGNGTQGQNGGGSNGSDGGESSRPSSGSSNGGSSGGSSNGGDGGGNGRGDKPENTFVSQDLCSF